MFSKTNTFERGSKCKPQEQILINILNFNKEEITVKSSKNDLGKVVFLFEM